jgi:hypothetical protein
VIDAPYMHFEVLGLSDALTLSPRFWSFDTVLLVRVHHAEKTSSALPL